MPHAATRDKFTAALDGLVARLQQDRAILAAILCGSLSHDTVWDKSDIDLVLVTIDDKQVGCADIALYADGVNVHANLMPRTAFRATVDGSMRNSFMHSLLSKGRLLYSHDPTIPDLLATLERIGDRDTEIQLLRASAHALPLIYKAHKWFLTREDLDYTALWILYAATPLAEIELVSARRLVDREVIPRALALNPPFFKTIYTDLLNTKKTRAAVQRALDAVDAYVAERAPSVFSLVIEHLREVAETRSATEINEHFKRNFDIGETTTVCEYLADRGLIGKASMPARMTKRSNVEVQELAFYHIDRPTNGRHTRQ
jgi:hypothetical protein